MSQIILPKVELADWARRFRWEAEILTRRRDLFRPKDEAEYLTTLRWLVACGEERDIELIEISRRIVGFHSKEADWLIRQASHRIRARNLSRRELGRYVSRELTYPGPLDFVAHQSAQLIRQVNSMNPEASKEWVIAHSRAAEIIERRVQLVRPDSKTELQKALYWADACGEEAEAQLLDAHLVGAFTYCDKEVLELADRAKKSINNRLKAARLIDEMLKPATEPEITVVTDALRMGMRSRGTGAPRGNVIKPADVRLLLDDSKRSQAERLLRSHNPDLRKQFALMLGEWGGELEAKALAKSLRENWERKDGVQFARYCIAALKNIGGQTSVCALCDAVENGPEVIQLAALNAIEELVTGGSEVYGEGTPHFNPPRGRYAKGEPPAPGTEQITGTLKKMMHTGSKAVRDRSKDLLYHALV